MAAPLNASEFANDGIKANHREEDDDIDLCSKDDVDESRNAMILIPTDSFDNIAAFLEPNANGGSPCSKSTSSTTVGCEERKSPTNHDHHEDESVEEFSESSVSPPPPVSDDGNAENDRDVQCQEADEDVAAKEVEAGLMQSSTTSLEHSADWHSPEWRHHRKHIFILSCAGKPIYTRHGDEDRQASLMGTMLALSQFLQHSQEKMDAIRCICAGDRKFVFLPRDHMVLVAVARSHESIPSLLLQLTYVYNQIISILTYNRVATIFKRHMNFDLRRLLSGAEKFINSLLDLMDYDPCFILSAVRCLPLDSSSREAIGQTIAQNVKVKDLVFALLIAEDQLIALVHMKKFLLHPVDLHMIFNLVTASDAFKHAESWSPVCLPRFDARAYLHAHISYLDETCQACLVMLSVDKDMFYTLSECKNKIQERLQRHGYIDTIHEALKRKSFKVSEVGIPGILHFLYKAKNLGQFTEPEYDAPYSSTEERERLFALYQCVYSRMHSQLRPLKIIFHVGKHEAILGWVTSGFEMYATFSPLTSKPAAIAGINKLLRWIKREEDRLFILNSHTL